jgi:hypothetical protein
LLDAVNLQISPVVVDLIQDSTDLISSRVAAGIHCRSAWLSPLPERSALAAMTIVIAAAPASQGLCFFKVAPSSAEMPLDSQISAAELVQRLVIADCL